MAMESYDRDSVYKCERKSLSGWIPAARARTGLAVVAGAVEGPLVDVEEVVCTGVVAGGIITPAASLSTWWS